MKNLKYESAKLISQSANNLVKVIPSASFEFWQRKDFRLYVEFKNLPQIEQDRIFNELEISLLGLFILHLENAILTTNSPEQRLIYSSLKGDLVPSFLQLFQEQGIEKKYINQWNILIDMRLKEYRQDYMTAYEETKNLSELKEGKEFLKIAWARIETITIDCLKHIKRGKTEADDPLWQLLRKWIISLDSQLSGLTKA